MRSPKVQVPRYIKTFIYNYIKMRKKTKETDILKTWTGMTTVKVMEIE